MSGKKWFIFMSWTKVNNKLLMSRANFIELLMVTLMVNLEFKFQMATIIFKLIAVTDGINGNIQLQWLINNVMQTKRRSREVTSVVKHFIKLK